MELNRNAENYFAQIEQLAFNPANVVPGISFSPDKMLQSRLFNYGDAQRYRLGVNHHQIPVNAPGARSTAATATAQCVWTATTAPKWDTKPNSKGTARAARLCRAAAVARRRKQTTGTTAKTPTTSRNRAEAVPPDDTGAAASAVREYRALGGWRLQAIQQRHIAHCTQADPAYGAGVAKGAGSAQGGLSDRENRDARPVPGVFIAYPRRAYRR